MKEITGYGAPEIINSTQAAITAVELRLNELDRALARCLKQDLADPTSYASPGLRAPWPHIVDHHDHADMGRLNIQSAPGVPLAENPVVVSIVDLHRAGYVNLPGAAGQYAEAEARLATCAPSAAASNCPYFPQSVPLFNEARDVLGGILRYTRDVLTAAAEALVEAANAYQLTDAEQAEYVRQAGQLVPPTTEEPRTTNYAL